PSSFLDEVKSEVRTLIGRMFPMSGMAPEMAPEPSQLKKSELIFGFVWVLGIALFAGAFLGFGAVHTLGWGAGYLAAVGIHETGHRLYSPDRNAELSWVGGNLEWGKKDSAGVWQPIRDARMQKAGPRFSRWAMGIAVSLLM